MSEKVYSLDGARGRHIDVYEDKVIISVKTGFGSFVTGNVSDGEKTIYYCDCIGIQYKKSGFTLGFLQFETASGLMNNRKSNYFNENTFTWDSLQLPNAKMEEVSKYCKTKVDEWKSGKYNQANASVSQADELLKFKKLRDMGVISEEEFETKKKQILGM